MASEKKKLLTLFWRFRRLTVFITEESQSFYSEKKGVGEEGWGESQFKFANHNQSALDLMSKL